MTAAIIEEQTKRRVIDEINRLGNGTPTLWKIFFLCMTPGILNGLHMSSYVFLGPPPESLTCIIPALYDNPSWSNEQIRNVSTSFVENKCNIRNWNYSLLGEMSYEDATAYIVGITMPPEVPCWSMENNRFAYDNDGLSIVSEWDLVCDREVLRTTVQVALSLGKFMGAFFFGIISDKYGRKTTITITSFIYVVCGPVAAFATSYWLFVFARVGLGIAGAGIYHSSYTVLTEFASPKYRSTLSIVFSVSYPIGMVILALTAYLVHPWRHLQLALSIPALLLVIHYFFLDESPRWLMKKGKFNKAHTIVFGQPMQNEKEYLELVRTKAESEELHEKKASFQNGLRQGCTELIRLYGNGKMRGRLLICHFTFFVTSLTYYVIALNGDNFLANQYIYVAVTGLTEVPSYILPCFMFRYMGRKRVSLILFFVAGVALLAVLLIPRDNTDWAVAVAMFGRTCISAVFAVVILQTAELFPTDLRSSAVGTSSTMAHIGSISAPYIADLLGSVAWYIPTTICGVASILAGLLELALPETKDISLDEDVD